MAMTASERRRIRDEEAERQAIRDEREGKAVLWALAVFMVAAYAIWRWWGGIVDGWFA